ncbi:hypothetical protein, partial [Bifidobacterium adolescentis]|uniref:hypothetical protein n=1 Tax=Bifidobacterium adolescentis TaxID=1680 RepID=UPI0034A489FB
NRTKAGPCPFHRNSQPNLRKKTGVIFQSRFFVLPNENRTQDTGHALLRQSRNPKVRKNPNVIRRRIKIDI